MLYESDRYDAIDLMDELEKLSIEQTTNVNLRLQVTLAAWYPWHHDGKGQTQVGADIKKYGLGVDSCAIYVVRTALAADIEVTTEVGEPDIDSHLLREPAAASWWDVKKKCNGTGARDSKPACRSVYVYQTFSGQHHPGMPLSLYKWSPEMEKKPMCDRLKHFLKPSMSEEKKTAHLRSCMCIDYCAGSDVL